MYGLLDSSNEEESEMVVDWLREICLRLRKDVRQQRPASWNDGNGPWLFG